jgi:phage baseplate assembly protein gpV
MAGYTRQSAAQIVSGEVISASPINAELNQVLAAFNNSTGHAHDGTAAEGPPIDRIADSDQKNAVLIDTSNNHIEFYTEVSSTATQQVRIQDGAIVPITDNDIDLGTASLEFKDVFVDGIAHIDTLDIDENATVAGTLDVTGALTGTNVTASTAFLPDASDGASLGTSSLEFSDLFLADGAVINLGDDQDVTLTHVADTGVLLNSTNQLQFGDSGTYIHQSADGVLDLVSDTEIEINATTVDINGAVDVSGNTAVGGTLTSTGKITADAGIDIDNFNIDGLVI